VGGIDFAREEAVMKYAALESDAGLALQYDALALASLASVSNRFLPWTNASLRPAGIQVALNDIVVNRRKVVLELGSGLSTVYLAAMLAAHGGTLVTVDHDADWVRMVQSWLPPAHGAVTTAVHAKLVPTTFDGEEVQWYDAARIEAVLSGLPPVDLLLIDGPPAYCKARCLNRGPALAHLRPRLASSATILLDDFNRAGERHIAGCWSEVLGVEARDLTVEAGLAVWLLGRANNISQ
jgi:hypothetical protein